MRQRTGIALVVVLLVTCVALLAFLSASSTMSLTGRSAVSQERSAAQALLAADSALKTLRARATAAGYDGSEPLDTWIGRRFGDLDLGADVSASVRVIATEGRPLQRLTIEATGRTGTSQRVLVQDFEVLPSPPVPATITVPGALTSVGSIVNSSNAALVSGHDNDDASWSRAGAPLCSAEPGEYVVIADVVYEVEGTPACGGTMALRSTTGGSIALAGSSLVTHRPFAIKEPLALVAGDPWTSTVRVTAAARTLFGPGSAITIGDGTSGTVTSVDGDVLSIDWASLPLAGRAEGTIVRRGVASGVTAATCQVRSTAFPNGCHGAQDLDDLFFRTFGVSSPEALKVSLDASRRIQGRELGTRTLSGVTWLSNPENNVRGQTGSGILIIETDADQSITLNVHNDFTGLIYVIGNASIQGNQAMRGAVIVDGVATVRTSVQGNGDKVAYDPLALARALAGIEFANAVPGGLGAPIANTWRVR